MNNLWRLLPKEFQKKVSSWLCVMNHSNICHFLNDCLLFMCTSWKYPVYSFFFFHTREIPKKYTFPYFLFDYFRMGDLNIVQKISLDLPKSTTCFFSAQLLLRLFWNKKWLLSDTFFNALLFANVPKWQVLS